jgi:alkanesulfonate monooxygenase SsuD/methylene tetrahydromethanopterin reductase-like flavin-dependent oxidoreductase (luciferase family)
LKPEIGILLPTFGAQATPSRVLDTARKAEAYGFHSVWTRDHLFIPADLSHGGVVESGFHLEALTVLAAVASITERVKLGTAILIPIRHPLALAQVMGTISYLGGDRMILGLGRGAFVEEFRALNISTRRKQLLRETLEVFRAFTEGEALTYSGEINSFEGVKIDPLPPLTTPLWYGGSGTQVSVELAYDDDYDGWMGMAPADVLDELLALSDKLAEQKGRPITISTIPPASIAPTREQALEPLDTARMLESIRSQQKREYDTFDDVASAYIIGSPDEAAAQLVALGEKGVDVVILDLRVVGDRFDDVFDLVGESVLPLVARATTPAGRESA